MTKRIILVTSRFFGNNELKFKTLLPIFGAQWPSFGNYETLTYAGQCLDELPVEGVSNAAWLWEKAAQIASDYRHYTEPRGPYHTHCQEKQKGSYLPGNIWAAPVYDGRYDRWGFRMEFRDILECVSIELYTGPEDDAAVRAAQVFSNLHQRDEAEVLRCLGGEFDRANIKYNC